MENTKLLDSYASLYKKRFSFCRQNDWELPTFAAKTSEIWKVTSLNSMKQKLNSTKSLLNDKGEDWHEHTAWIDKASLVIKTIKNKIEPEILTRAWCKFFEILSSFNLIPDCKSKLKTLHLCEAPGAFISALNYYLCVHHPSIEWRWIANTLNPYYEGHNIRSVVVDDRLIFPTLRNWHFGQDDTGDLTDISYIEDISNLVCQFECFDLVTADGSVDCLNTPGEQELAVSKLHFAEILVALNSLLPSGCFVIKKFTFFECITVCELYLLNTVFDQVHIFKPCTSRASNSEVYVICIGFHRSEALTNLLEQFKDIYKEKNMLPFFLQSVIPKSFMDQLEECVKMFVDLQIEAINENLDLYKNKTELDVQILNELKEACAEEFVKRYSVKPSLVYESSKLFSAKKRVLTSFSDKTNRNHKIIYFQAVGDTFENIMKSTCMEWYDKLLDVKNRIDLCFPASNKRLLEEIEWHFPSKEIRNRMKSKNFQNWIIPGKKILCIQNSKFCYPVLLHLWNRISHEAIVDVQLHVASQCYFDMDILIKSLMTNDEIRSDLISISPDDCYENDPILLSLKNVFVLHQIYHPSMNIDAKKTSDVNKIVYINSTQWVISLHQETIIKKNLTDVFHFSLKLLIEGDTLLLCVQSILTRYMTGLLFMVISVFEKFTTILPEDCALAGVGQIWVFKNFQKRKWMDNILKHLATIKSSSGEKDILQIVPMTSLCNNAFYTHLRDVNNKHLLHRIRSFIST